MSTNFFKTALIAGMAVMGFAACNKDDDGGNIGGTASMKVRLTDGPADYDAVFLDVEKVEINTATNGWVTLPLVRTGLYNILQFRNGADTLLGQVQLPVGRVNEMRLILGDDSYLVDNGQSYDLDVPSGQSSGFKLKMDDTLVAGGAYETWLDFDAAKSIIQTGNGQYKLKPVVRAYTALTNGRIRGYVLPPAAGATVYAINGTDTFSAIPAADGFFMISGLPQGNYMVHYDASLSTYADVMVPAVAVAFGAITELGTKVLLP
jgi:hypothetical protein